MAQLAAWLNGALAVMAQQALHWTGFQGIARPVLAAGIVAAAWFSGRVGTYLLASAFRIALVVAGVLLAYQVLVAPVGGVGR
jgi:hypothetical protein